MKEILKKIADAFEGSKRRIALLGALVSEATPEHTVVHWIGKGVFVLFGSADVIKYAKSKINNLKLKE